MLDRTKDWQEYQGSTPNQSVTTVVALGALFNPVSSGVLLLVREAVISARGSGAASAFLAEIRRATAIAGGALVRGGIPTLSLRAYDGPRGRASVGRIYCATASNGGAATPVTYTDDTDVPLDQMDVGGAYAESQCRFSYRGLVLAPGDGLVARASSGAAVAPGLRFVWLEIPQDTIDVRRAIADLRRDGML